MDLHATGIYAIENLLNGRVYVGATKAGLQQRWHAHLSMLFQRSHYCSEAFRADAHIYGACAFRCILLQSLPSSTQMAPFEAFWIHYIRSLGVDCYNSAPPFEQRFPANRWRAVPPVYQYTTRSAYSYCQAHHGLEFCENRLQALARIGKLPAFFDGQRWYFRADDLDFLCAGYEPAKSGQRRARKKRITTSSGATLQKL